MSGDECTMPSCSEPVADERATGGLCEFHLNGGSSSESTPDESVAEAYEYDFDHENPHDVRNTTDEERAQMLVEYLERFEAEFGTVPSVMPLDEDKQPWITGRSRLDDQLPTGEEMPTEAVEAVMVDGYEAARQIDEKGAGGFALYAGRQEFGTHDVVFVDHDEADEFPAPTGEPTLKVLSGSGRGPHETYRNDADDRVRNARVGDNYGEVRARNHYVVVPGSIHPSGGIYHVTENRDIATLSDSELTDRERPSTASTSKSKAAKEIEDIEGECEAFDDESVEDLLETAFANQHDGERIEKVYNGQYASAGFDDRSAAEYWLANRLDSWVGRGNETRVERVMDKGNLQKWSERTDRAYRESVLAGVGSQDWYYDPSADAGGENGTDAYGKEIVATLPNSPKTRAATKGSRWYDNRGEDTSVLTQQDVYDRVRGAISDAMDRYDNVVIDAIMGGGKTYNFFGALADRDERGAYFAPRVELYEQAVEYAMDNGFERDECYILPSIKRDCPTWRGEHGQDDEHLVKRLYALGVQPKTIHNLIGDELGCRQNESGKCEYEHKSNFEPDDYQLLVGHYAHAHLPHVTKKRHCAFDEDPQNAFTTRVEGSELIKGVNAFLELEESPDFDGWDDLIQHRNDDKRRERGLAWFDRPEFEFEPDERNAVRFKDEGFHAYAPLAVYTILSADPLEEGYPFERASLPGLGNSGQFFTTTGESGEHYVELSTPPDLAYANSIIALDGTPLLNDGKPVEWTNALDRPMNYRQVLTDDERTEFLSETQGNVYVQTSGYIKPYSSAKWNDAEQDAATLAAVREAYGDGDPPVVFTDKKVRDEYEELGFVEEGLAETFDHPGNLRGSDEYGDCRLAVQLGSSHHGDHEVRRRAAMLGETVDPEGKGAERDYGTDLGNALVYQMREAQSAQNALRVGRDGNGALFVFDTCAFPDWIPVEGGIADVSLWSKTEQALRGAWSGDGPGEAGEGITTSEASEAVGDVAGDRYVRMSLDRLAERGYLSKESDPKDGRRTLWVDTGISDVAEHHAAEVDLPEIDFDAASEDDEVAEVWGSMSIRETSAKRVTLYHTSTRPGEDTSVNAGDGSTPSESGGSAPGGGAT